MSFPDLSYFPGIPNPPNAPSVDVPNMQTNTNNLQTYLQRDHIPFGSGFDGMHLQVNLQETTLSGTPALPPNLAGSGFGTLYATTNSSQIGGNAGEIYYTRGGSAQKIQLTGPLNPTSAATPATNQASNGYTFLAGGILMQFGKTNPLNGSSKSFSFPVTYNNILSFSIASTSNSNSFYVSALSTSGFTIATVGGASSGSAAYWIAVGN